MDETTKLCSKAQPSRLRRLLRLPSFGVALTISLATLLAFAVWMFVDAEFLFTLAVIRTGLRSAGEADSKVVEIFSILLGPRLILFWGLAAIGTLSTLLVFYRMLFGNRRARTLRSIFIATALVAIWLTFYLSHEKLSSAGFRWRLHRAVQGLKEDAAILLAKWPTADGTLPYSGDYVIAGNNPPTLFVMSFDSFPMRETVGAFITRAGDGGIMFDYDPGRVEYHPDANAPRTYTDGSQDRQKLLRMKHVLQDYIELEPNWFFATYVIATFE
jgi:hypothetical protein